MHLRPLLSIALSLHLAVSSPVHYPPTQQPLSETLPHPYSFSPSLPDPSFKFPTVHDSAILARRLLALSPLGTLSTTFPSHLPSPRLPSSVSNLPIGLPDYISACGTSPHASDPVLLAINIATTFRNALSGDHSNVSLSIQWISPHEDCIVANLPRVSLLGYLQPIVFEAGEERETERCFVERHPDARWWLPSEPGSPHASQWVRLVVREVYWIGGFGDRNYIGWIPEDVWSGVTEDEWKHARLRGEERMGDEGVQ